MAGLKGSRTGDRAVGVVGHQVAGQSAGVAAAIIGDGSAIILSHNVGIEIDQPLARYSRRNRSHAVRGMAGRTGESILRYVVTVPLETGIRYHVGQIVTLGAHAIRSIETEVGIRKSVGDQSAWRRRLAELIIVLEDVRVHRTVRTVRPGASELSVVVAIVTVGAENLDSHQSRRRAVLVQHIREQTGLWQDAHADVSHGMAGSPRRAEFRNYIQGIRGRDYSRGRVSVDEQSLLADTRAVTTQAGFELIDGRKQSGGTVAGANSGNVRLRGTKRRRSGKCDYLHRAMSSLEFHTSLGYIVIQYLDLGGVR